MLTALSNLTYSICPSLPQAITSAYQKTTEAVGKAADSVFSLCSEFPFPMNNQAVISGCFSTITLSNLYRGAPSNIGLLAMGILSHAGHILYDMGHFRSEPLLRNVEKTAKVFREAFQELEKHPTQVEQVRSKLVSYCIQNGLKNRLPKKAIELKLALKKLTKEHERARNIEKWTPIAFTVLAAGMYTLGLYK